MAATTTDDYDDDEVPMISETMVAAMAAATTDDYNDDEVPMISETTVAAMAASTTTTTTMKCP